MKVLVTGSDGYCGWPVVLRLLNEGYSVIGVDNGFRRNWVDEVGSESVVPVGDIDTRYTKVKEVYKNYDFIHCDLTDYIRLRSIIDSFKPDIVMHLASQPSAPYSSIDISHCNFTQHNNTQMLRNILWALNDAELHNTHLIVTTTTGIYGAPDFDIPEGNIVINKMELPFPSMAGSWYHMSRAHDAANLWLAAKQFKFPITELRTSIVCGSSTKETQQTKEFWNRFDIDFYFGVVVNRFVAQALGTKQLTVYGKGLQSKPMISLEDMVQSVVNCCTLKKEKQYEIFNQTEKPISIVGLANTIQDYFKKHFQFEISVEHISNPRIEDEEHNMIMHNEQFINKLCNGKVQQTIEEAIEVMCRDLYQYKEKIIKLARK